MTRQCCAKNCKNKKIPGSGISFHRFPLNNANSLAKWLRNFNRHGFKPSKSSMICSFHFENDCFEVGGQGNRLKRSAVPTKFDGVSKNSENNSKASFDGSSEMKMSDAESEAPTATMATDESHPSATGNEKKEHGSNPIRGRICISSEFPRWQKLRESLQLRSHSEVARVLLDWYFSHQDCYRPPFPSSNLYGNLTKDNESLELSNDEAHDSLNNIDYSEYQHQKKADLFLDGQDIQVFDTTSNELVFRTSLKRPSVNHSRKNKRRNSFTVPFSRNRNYHSSSEEEEEPVADPTDPTYEPTVANETCQSRSISHRRRSNRLRNTEDEFEDTELSEDYKVEIKEEFPEKFADEGSLDDTVSEEKSL